MNVATAEEAFDFHYEGMRAIVRRDHGIGSDTDIADLPRDLRDEMLAEHWRRMARMAERAQSEWARFVERDPQRADRWQAR